MNLKLTLLKNTCSRTAARVRTLKPTSLSFGLRLYGASNEELLEAHFIDLKNSIIRLQLDDLTETDKENLDSEVSAKLRDIDKCFDKIQRRKNDRALYDEVAGYYEFIADEIDSICETPSRIENIWFFFKRLEYTCNKHHKQKLSAKCHVEQLYRELSRLQTKMDILGINYDSDE